MNSTTYTDQLLADYETLEPGESDTWNPLKSEYELTYRLALFYALAQSLAMSTIPIQELKVLDLGCGNGRSTRMYIDLGLFPQQLTGLDVRPGTIELAKKLHPGICYMSYDGAEIPFPAHSFNWVSVTTALSSIRGESCRKQVVEQIYQALPPGGYAFYFDLRLVTSFAGGGRVLPLQLFSKFEKIWYYPVRRINFIPRNQQFSKLMKALCSGDMKQLQSRLLSTAAPFIRCSHEALLVQKR